MNMREGALFAIVKLKDWPPSTTQNIFTRTEGDSIVDLIALPGGKLLLNITSNNLYKKEYLFQPFKLLADQVFLINIVWHEKGTKLMLNEQEIPPYHDDIPILIQFHESDTDNFSLDIPENPLSFKDDLDELFFNTYIDIYKKYNENTKYSILRASGLLRQLFLDKKPLVHSINKKYKLKILFETVDFITPPPIPFEDHWCQLYAGNNPNTIHVNLNKFLSAECLHYKYHPFNVKEIIKSCANIRGGVHIGAPESESEKKLLDFNQVFSVLGDDPSIALLKSIILVSLVALQPLFDLITKHSINK